MVLILKAEYGGYLISFNTAAALIAVIARRKPMWIAQ